MNIKVPGTLDIGENGVSVVPTARKPRQALGLLAFHADRVVSGAALAELAGLVNRYPAREPAQGQYMLAPHRSGWRGEALDAYQRLRAILVQEMGLEPLAELRRMRRLILRVGPGAASQQVAGVMA